MAKKLSRESILNVDDLRREEMEIPEWKGVITVRSLRGSERDRWARDVLDERGKPKENLNAMLIYYGCEEPKFEKEDIEILQQKSVAVTERIVRKIMELSGISLESVDEIRKNS